MKNLKTKSYFIAYSYLLGYCEEELGENIKALDASFEEFKIENKDMYDSIFVNKEESLVDTEEEFKEIQPLVREAFKDLHEKYFPSVENFEEDDIEAYVKLLFSPSEILQISEEKLDKMLNFEFKTKEERYEQYRKFLFTTNVKLAQLAGEDFDLEDIKESIAKIPDNQLSSIIYMLIISARDDNTLLQDD